MKPKKKEIYISIYEYIKKNRNESIKGSEKKKETRVINVYLNLKRMYKKNQLNHA